MNKHEINSIKIKLFKQIFSWTEAILANFHLRLLSSAARLEFFFLNLYGFCHGPKCLASWACPVQGTEKVKVTFRLWSRPLRNKEVQKQDTTNDYLFQAICSPSCRNPVAKAESSYMGCHHPAFSFCLLTSSSTHLLPSATSQAGAYRPTPKLWGTPQSRDTRCKNRCNCRQRWDCGDGGI